MLRTETVAGKTLELLKELQETDILQSTRLVGGTALSLQIGHRISEDLNLFTTKAIEPDLLNQTLEQKFNFIPSRVFGNSLIGQIDGIKVDIIYHPYKWIGKLINENGFRIASLNDITAMKLHAVINSGKRPKDFVDLAYLSQIYSYDTMKDFLKEKYPAYDPIMADRAINFFDEVEADNIPRIKMINESLNFEKIKQRLIRMTDRPEYIFKTNPLESKTKNIKPPKKGIRR